MGETDGAFTEHIEVRVPTDTEPVMEESVPSRPTPVQRAFRLSQAIPRRSLRQRDRGAAQEALPLGFSARQSDGPASPTVEPTVEPIGEDVSSHPGTEFVSAPSVDQQTDGSGGVFADLASVIVGVGDLVFIRYDDQPDRRISVRLSNTENNPGDGVVHVGQPLGTAILGSSLDEQVAMKIGNRTRTAVIEKIEKPRSVQALAAE
jgi:hypothetical protein